MFGGSRARKSLVVLTDGLRNFVNADGAFRAVRAAWSNDHLTLLTSVELGRLAKAAPYFDRVFTDGAPSDADSRKGLAKKLRKEHFKRVIDLDRSRRAYDLIKIFKPFPPKWSGVAPGASWRVRANALEGLHPFDQFTAQLTATGLQTAARAPDLTWALESRKDSANMQPSWYGLSGHFGLLAPSSDDARRWPAEKWAELAMTLSESGVVPVLIGGRDKQSLANAITRRAPSLVNLAGKTDLLQVAALAASAAFFVGDDTAPVHLCAAAGCGGVLLVGPASRPEIANPRGGAVVLLTAGQLSDIPIRDIMRTLGNAGLLPSAYVERRAVLT